MRTISRITPVALSALLALPGVATAHSDTARPTTPVEATPGGAQEYATDDTTFFDAPNPIPAGEHGDLIRFQVAEDGAGSRRYRIMYLSESVSGAPNVVTGLVDVPSVAAPIGGFGLILDGHGSSGLADRCAPSRLLDDNSRPHGLDSYGGAVSSGFVVASTDYEGLGGPGVHPFLVGVSSGRSMLDAGLAARQIPGVYIGNTTGIVGFSEGGHAALWAAQLAAEWTPGQHIVGSVIAAPASEVVALAHDGVGSNEFEAATLGIVAGLAAAYPEADAALDSVLAPTGRELLTAWTESACFFDEVPLSPGRFMAADPTQVEPFASLIAANTAGTVATPAPMMVIHGTEDQRVPFAHNQTLVDRLCAAGQVVQNVVLPAADAPAEFAHDYAAIEAATTGVDWLTGLMDGGTPITSCPGATAVAAPPPSGAVTGPVEFAPDDAAFYTVPSPLPAGEHGDLLRFQLADDGINLTYRIMYLSESAAGTPIAVTGVVVMSDDPAPFGGYHVLVHGHGSTGLADQCAPSTAAGGSSFDVDFDLDYQSFETVASFGFVLVSTDYEGLGVPGEHPFLDGPSEARSMLDAGRAVRQLPLVYAGAKTAVGGFSQGGHAALWAAQVAPEYTPEQQIFAGLLASAASEVPELVRAGVTDPSRQELTVWTLLGLAAAHPEAQAALGTVLTPAGTQLAGLLTAGCSLEGAAVPPPLASLLAANTAGAVATTTPLLMFHGDADTNIPLAQSDALLARLCAGGQVVERRVVPGANHGSTISSATIEGREWLAGLADGTTQPATSCLT
jgi:dienelactone hydrolase